ncbi:MAG: hypothetical protein HC848_07165 [Limnobacter sp.]|nr:hypothetical protein [Limnobacter sp.]
MFVSEDEYALAVDAAWQQESVEIPMPPTLDSLERLYDMGILVRSDSNSNELVVADEYRAAPSPGISPDGLLTPVESDPVVDVGAVEPLDSATLSAMEAVERTPVQQEGLAVTKATSPAKLQEIATLNNGGNPVSLEVASSADGEKVVVVRNQANNDIVGLYGLNPDNTVGEQLEWANLSPDMAMAIANLSPDDNVEGVVTPDGFTFISITFMGAPPATIHWGPDGGYLGRPSSDDSVDDVKGLRYSATIHGVDYTYEFREEENSFVMTTASGFEGRMPPEPVPQDLATAQWTTTPVS